MIVQINLQDNYKFHLNNALRQLKRALTNKAQDNYLMGFLSAALALELGMKLAVKETINGNIFVLNKDGSIKLSKTLKRKMTLPYREIIECIKINHSQFETIILDNFSVKIDPAIFDDEIDYLTEIRNSLFHYEGEFDQGIISYILKAFVFINILLPSELSIANILINKNDFLTLLKKSSLKFTGVLENANEILIHKDNYFDININLMYGCPECGYESLVALETNNGHCYLCLLCSHHDYLLTCFDCGTEIPGEHTYEVAEHIFLCDDCYSNKFD